MSDLIERAELIDKNMAQAKEIERLQARVEALELIVDAAKEWWNAPNRLAEDASLGKLAALIEAATEQGKCSHDWFKPDDTDNVKWGEYQLCRACHAIGIPATEQEGQ